MYLIERESYKKLLTNNITKDYMKTTLENVNVSDNKSADIAKDLNLENRMTKHTTNDCYVTLKDHKDEFMDKMPCRLINPAKSDIQKVSKVILDEMNDTIRNNTGLNQWKNTQAVHQWFASVYEVQTCRLTSADV